jgi:hypothetical protein
VSGLSAAADASAADWVVAGVRDFGSGVASIVPAVFEAYARVFHPAHYGDPAIEVRWAQVAEANGRVMHPAAEWGSLTGSWQMQRDEDGLWDAEPATGELPRDVAMALAAVLAKHTKCTDRWWFAPSALRGELGVMILFPEGTPAEEQQRAYDEHEAQLARRQSFLNSAPLFSTPGREFRVLEGPSAALEELYEALDEAPSLWWPDDRAWCVGTDIDLMTTYVGGSEQCIEALLADERLEVLRVPVDQSVTWEADTINPLPGRPN